MLDYTIMEYNSETKKYTTLGSAFGHDSSEAKENYIREQGWNKKQNTGLFAKPPLCR